MKKPKFSRKPTRTVMARGRCVVCRGRFHRYVVRGYERFQRLCDGCRDRIPPPTYRVWQTERR